MGLTLVNITSGPLLPLAHIYQTPTLTGGRCPGGGLADTKLVTHPLALAFPVSLLPQVWSREPHWDKSPFNLKLQ